MPCFSSLSPPHAPKQTREKEGAGVYLESAMNKNLSMARIMGDPAEGSPLNFCLQAGTIRTLVSYSSFSQEESIVAGIVVLVSRGFDEHSLCPYVFHCLWWTQT